MAEIGAMVALPAYRKSQVAAISIVAIIHWAAMRRRAIFGRLAGLSSKRPA
jgi:hypothetical protein